PLVNRSSASGNSRERHRHGCTYRSSGPSLLRRSNRNSALSPVRHGKHDYSDIPIGLLSGVVSGGSGHLSRSGTSRSSRVRLTTRCRGPAALAAELDIVRRPKGSMFKFGRRHGEEDVSVIRPAVFVREPT